MMSISSAQKSKIAGYVRDYILRTAQNYGHQNAVYRANNRWKHTLNVVQNVKLILEGEGSAPDVCDVCEIAAMFHDIDHYTVQAEYHAQRGAETATRYLTKEGYDPEFVKRVAYAVREHDRDLNDEESIETQVQKIRDGVTHEARMVMDGDTLDKVGVSNILQAIVSMGTTNKRHITEFARELVSGWPLDRAKMWKEILTTETGRKIGEERFAFYEQFLKQIETEIVMYDPYQPLGVTQEMTPVSPDNSVKNTIKSA
jgi:HD superfamily phosphodiesterase